MFLAALLSCRNHLPNLRQCNVSMSVVSYRLMMMRITGANVSFGDRKSQANVIDTWQAILHTFLKTALPESLLVTLLIPFHVLFFTLNFSQSEFILRRVE